MTEKAVDADDWDVQYARLATLSKNVETAAAFDALYERLAAAVVMMRLVDVAGVVGGLYRVRLSMLQTLCHEQMAWAKAHAPEQFDRAEREVKANRNARERRERARMN